MPSGLSGSSSFEIVAGGNSVCGSPLCLFLGLLEFDIQEMGQILDNDFGDNILGERLQHAPVRKMGEGGGNKGLLRENRDKKNVLLKVI